MEKWRRKMTINLYAGLGTATASLEYDETLDSGVKLIDS